MRRPLRKPRNSPARDAAATMHRFATRSVRVMMREMKRMFFDGRLPVARLRDVGGGASGLVMKPEGHGIERSGSTGMAEAD
jgi:hypothetical protein